MFELLISGVIVVTVGTIGALEGLRMDVVNMQEEAKIRQAMEYYIEIGLDEEQAREQVIREKNFALEHIR